MRERYEREEYPGRRRGDVDRRRDRVVGWPGDVPPRAAHRDDWDDAERSAREDHDADDWGDVQVGRWGAARRPPTPRAEPERWERDESYWGGTTGRWSRDLPREPQAARGYAGDESQRRRYAGPDTDRDWQAAARSRPESGRFAGGGPFAGVGPKGYQRSDDRIREDVCDRLTADAYLDPSDVTVRVEHGDVTLEGTIDSREMKRRSEDVVDDVVGVRQVHNFLQVRNARGVQSPGAGTGESRA